MTRRIKVLMLIAIVIAALAVSVGPAVGQAVHQDCTAKVGSGKKALNITDCEAVTTPSGNTNGHFHNHPPGPK